MICIKNQNNSANQSTIAEHRHRHGFCRNFRVVSLLHCTFRAFFFFAYEIPGTLATTWLAEEGGVVAGHSRELKSFWSSGSTNFLLMKNFRIHPSHTQCRRGRARACLKSPAENSASPQSCKIFNGRLSRAHSYWPYNILLIIRTRNSINCNQSISVPRRRNRMRYANMWISFIAFISRGDWDRCTMRVRGLN